MPMYNPPHPGEIVKWECLEFLGLSVTRTAEVRCIKNTTELS